MNDTRIFIGGISRIEERFNSTEQWLRDHHKAMMASDLQPIIDEVTEVIKGVVDLYEQWREDVRLNMPNQLPSFVIQSLITVIAFAADRFRNPIAKCGGHIENARFEKFLTYLESELADWVEPIPSTAPGMNVLTFRKKIA